MDNNQVQVQAGKSARLKSWVIGGVAAGSAALVTLPAHAAITIPTEISDGVTGLAAAFGTFSSSSSAAADIGSKSGCAAPKASAMASFSCGSTLQVA